MTLDLDTNYSDKNRVFKLVQNEVLNKNLGILHQK